ncbi:MAG: isochorismatase family protein, partial [Methylococcales bacterium]|nr:isochorismatase family protein [Methylococcales bacterium]
MARSILITQCVQNDFVKPLGRFEALPNTLHIGHEESERLMGIETASGPLSKALIWAYEQPENELEIIHIRDWHDKEDISQASHLAQFGEHCIQNTEGADFAFPEDLKSRETKVVNASGLNDFIDTDLQTVLDNHKNENVNVGIVGVWTDAKISFLVYDLLTRYPRMRIGVCSALTASSSRSHHFMAIDQLQRILGIEVQASIGEFTEFLSGKPINFENLKAFSDLPKIITDGKANITNTDEQLIRYLYRDCKEVTLNTLDGGYSGNLVVGTQSIDINGHEQVPHVVKIGEQEEIGKERSSFERIENVMGNSAPRITDFADLKSRGAIKYRYASMGGGFSNTFQKLYQKGTDVEKIKSFLDTIFKEQLGRLYRAANRERIDLLEYYWFAASYAPRMKKKMEALLERDITNENDHVEILPGLMCNNMVDFYANGIDKIKDLIPSSTYMSYIHGDLNGANIIVDGQENIWLIDFFHTHHGHVIKDLAKLENDLLYICTEVNNEEDLRLACRFTDHLVKVHDLWNPMPEMPDDILNVPRFKRVYEVIGRMRSYYKDMVKTDRDP